MKNITGIMIYYYFVCKRKLWLFSNEITMEHESDNVMLGKLLDENSYNKEKKHIMIDNTINIDFIKKWEVLHEIKKSQSMEEASVWQIKYYLYFLKKRDIKVEKGILDYPKLKIRKEIILEKEDIKYIEEILKHINDIINTEKVPEFNILKICKNCSYYDYCLS